MLLHTHQSGRARCWMNTACDHCLMRSRFTLEAHQTRLGKCRQGYRRSKDISQGVLTKHLWPGEEEREPKYVLGRTLNGAFRVFRSRLKKVHDSGTRDRIKGPFGWLDGGYHQAGRLSQRKRHKPKIHMDLI
jgi:hypothetical protein